VVVRVSATPVDDRDGARLADEVLSALSELSVDGEQEEAR
jgi:hypothetical protein